MITRVFIPRTSERKRPSETVTGLFLYADCQPASFRTARAKGSNYCWAGAAVGGATGITGFGAGSLMEGVVEAVGLGSVLDMPPH